MLALILLVYRQTFDRFFSARQDVRTNETFIALNVKSLFLWISVYTFSSHRTKITSFLCSHLSPVCKWGILWRLQQVRFFPIDMYPIDMVVGTLQIIGKVAICDIIKWISDRYTFYVSTKRLHTNIPIEFIGATVGYFSAMG